MRYNLYHDIAIQVQPQVGTIKTIYAFRSDKSINPKLALIAAFLMDDGYTDELIEEMYYGALRY